MDADDKLLQEDEESSDDNASPYKSTMRRAASMATILQERG